MTLLFKILTLLLAPLGMALVLLAVALLVLRQRPRLARGLLVVALSGLYLTSTPWFAARLAAPLEAYAEWRPATDYPVVDTLVLLGGGVSAARPPRRPHHDLGASADRMHFAAELWHAGRATRIIVTGGSRAAPDHDEASAMRSVLQALGVPAEVIIEEPLARTTREHPAQVAALLGDVSQPVLLVTSATHMRRAVANFRNQGVRVLPAPTDFEIIQPGGLLDYLPHARALERSERVTREWLGLLHARVTGT